MYSRKSNKIKSAILSGMIAAVSVAGSFTTVAPAVTANAAGSDNYAKLLQYSLYFYDANMCGDQVGSKSAISWRDDCHTRDEVVGGFHDAGDHAMFGLPQGYTASTLGWSYYEFSDAFNATGQAEHLKAITDHFCDFFKKSTRLSGDTVSSFLYQKEDGNTDHAYWGAPEKQEQEQGVRKMYWTSNSASDIAADYAAALALNYINFGNAEDLKYAEALYKFSTQYNSLATDGPTGFYLADGATCKDEQAWAAGWLYLATKNESYKNDCASKQTQYLGWVHGWNTTDLGAACVYAEITNDWSKVNSYIGSTIQEKTQNGYFFMDKWGSARYNCSMQMTALVASKHSSADYGTWCKEQMNYITGNNPTGTCFVTGFAPNSAKNTHHRAASGYQGYMGEYGMNEHTTQYHPSAGHVLIGALAGGPEDSNGTYADVMNNYVANEVAIDYNAGLVGAAAGLYDVYKTGSCDTSITGVTKIYSGSVTPPVTQPPVTQPPVTQPPVTQTPTPSNNDVVLTPSDMTVGTEKGDDGEMNNYAEFKPQGAKSATLYYKVNSNDMNTSGAFGTWTGKWEQTDFENVSVPSDKIVAVDYTIPSNVGQTVKAMVFWPHGDAVTIEKVVLHMNGSSNPVVTQPPVTQPPVTQPPVTQPPVTQPPVTQTPTPSNNDVVLTPSNMTVGTEKGDDGEMNNYAEFKPQGAKSVTLYYKVNSNDMNTSGAFGTWTGKWEQKDFENVSVPSDKIVAVDYTIPSNVGQTVKAMVFWPHGDAVTIEKVVLHMDSSSNPVVTQPPVTQQPVQPGKTLYGDANEDGSVDIADATAIIQHMGNPDEYALSAQGAINADIVNTGDGVTGADAVVLQLLEAKKIKQTEFPITMQQYNSLLN